MNEFDTDDLIRESYERNCPTVDVDMAWEMLETRMAGEKHRDHQPSSTTKVAAPRPSGPRRSSGLRVAIYASIAVVLVAAVAMGAVAAAKYLGRDGYVLTIGDETTVTSTTTTTQGVTTTTQAVTTTTQGVTTTTQAVTTTTGLEGTTTTTEKLSTAETRLSNGNIKAMGFIDKVYVKDGKRYISIDYAQLLTGAAADAAAVAAGEIKPGEHVPDDFWIQNDNPQKRVFEVSDSVAITTSTWISTYAWNEIMDHPATWAQFKSFWSATPPADAIHLHGSPWWIERDGPLVVKIDEQFLP